MRALLILCLLNLSFSLFSQNRDEQYFTTPEDLNLTYTPYTISTFDQANLHCWHIHPKANKRDETIILSGDFKQNMTHSLIWGLHLAEAGYSIIMYDVRGTGKSSAFHLDSNQLYAEHFTVDLMTVMAWTKENHKPSRIGVLAFNEGSITSILASSKVKSDFLVQINPITDPKRKAYELSEKCDCDIKIPKSSDQFPKVYDNIKASILSLQLNDKLNPDRIYLANEQLGHHLKFLAIPENQIHSSQNIELIVQEMNAFLDSNQAGR
jgi:hypothetical protein